VLGYAKGKGAVNTFALNGLAGKRPGKPSFRLFVATVSVRFQVSDASFHLIVRGIRMASEFIAGLSLFKTAFDIAKGLKDINDATVRNSAIIELQEMILSARDQQAATLERISQLEKELARFENWEAEKQRYELADVGRGTFAYRLKPSMANGEPLHSICAYCFEDATKSILQPETKAIGGSQHLVCNRCDSDLVINGPRRDGSPPKVIRRDPNRR
jgi:hypothetical protein